MVETEGFNAEENLEKYNEYWSEFYTEYTTLADKVGQRLGLSPSKGTKNSIINQTLEETFMELAKSEKNDIYKCNSSDVFRRDYIAVYKYAKDKTKSEYMNVPFEDIPDEQIRDIIFVYNKDGSTTLREDLKEKAMELTTEKLKYLKEEEDKELQEFKQEGYLCKYNELRKTLYSFQTEGVVQDLDFAFNKEKGSGLYQVTNGKYEKIELL